MLIVLDYVCDLEATILVVSSKHHVKDEKSYGKGNNYSPAGYGNGGQQQYDQQQYGNGGQQQYDQQQYGGNQGGYGNGGQQYDQQQYGDNQGGYGGSSPSYGGQQEKDQAKSYATPEALRLKCSHIATHSEHDCQVCCVCNFINLKNSRPTNSTFLTTQNSYRKTCNRRTPIFT
jgi:hypothetical protein